MPVSISDSVKRKRISLSLAAGTILLFLLASSSLCHSLYLVAYSMPMGYEVRVLVPPGYEGPILIIWSVLEGQPAEVKDNGRLHYYRIQDDGVLLIQDDPPDAHPAGLPLFHITGHLTFWYEHPEQILRNAMSGCPDAPDQATGLCWGGIGSLKSGSRKEHPYQSFISTTFEGKDRVWNQLDKLRSVYVKELSFQEEGNSR